MPAALRSWIGPATSSLLRVGAPIVPFVGGRLIAPAHVDDVYAPGTYRKNACFTRPQGTCATRLIVHVGGRGVDTTQIADGDYRFCVAGVTIRNVAHHRCWPITIANAGSGG
jgi:hypothetical protein